ncbi:MAG: hypothetical protein GYA21_17925 [Myxococcales bacterium]|nr:hypothetical protein [Myxococcales bacterium]
MNFIGRLAAKPHGAGAARGELCKLAREGEARGTIAFVRWVTAEAAETERA